MVTSTLAPDVPADYYERIFEAEQTHWWHRGMLAISAVLLGSRLTSGGVALDVGCGTGGFLRFLVDNGCYDSVVGADLASAAIDLARERVPEAELHVAPMSDLGFGQRSFDLVVMNDVLQHLPESDIAAALLELHRVLVPSGALLVRTNGSRRLRRERDDWRAYDAATLRRSLEDAGFAVERLTYANVAFSAFSLALGRTPHAPSEEQHGIPRRPGRLVSGLGRSSLAAEARWLGRGGSLPYGHTLFAVAVRR